MSTGLEDSPPRARTLGRRRFLTFLVAAPTLTVGVGFVDGSDGPTAQAQDLLPDLPATGDLVDLSDFVAAAAAATMNLVVLEVTPEGRVRLELPRTEVGQGISTALAMVVADEIGVPLDQVDVPLSDARPELLFNQLTGGSLTIRTMYEPLRHLAAAVRDRLLRAASEQWSIPQADLVLRDALVVGPGALSSPLGPLSGPAAALPGAVVPGNPKPESEQTLVSTPTRRIDARRLVTGQHEYTMDLDIPGAVPAMVRRAPSIGGTLRRVRNAEQVKAMPGIIDLVELDHGVAVVAETFGQALDGKNALEVDWKPGPMDDVSDDELWARLRAAAPPLTVPPLGAATVDAEFQLAPVSHAPLETNCAVADVRDDSAEIWVGTKVPIIAQQEVAARLGLRQDKVTVHVIQAGGSFGRRLFADPVFEAAEVSRALGRPIRLMWTRIDDMRHGRARPPMVIRMRATLAAGEVAAFETRVGAESTDFGQGLGEILVRYATQLPGGNATFTQAAFAGTQSVPYKLGALTQLIREVPIGMNTGSWRAVFSPLNRGCQEILLDEVARRLGRDPVEFRLASLRDDRHRDVLRRAAELGDWGRTLPRGFGRGIAFHSEHRSSTACVVELDGRDPEAPRVTRATITVDVGRPINPLGLQAQMIGGLTDGIATALKAGLHLDRGLPLEGSYSQFHYARQKDSPPDVRVEVMPTPHAPGGAGELGVTAAFAAVALAYGDATGIAPRRFPLNFPVDFEPFPR